MEKIGDCSQDCALANRPTNTFHECLGRYRELALDFLFISQARRNLLLGQQANASRQRCPAQFQRSGNSSQSRRSIGRQKIQEPDGFAADCHLPAQVDQARRRFLSGRAAALEKQQCEDLPISFQTVFLIVPGCSKFAACRPPCSPHVNWLRTRAAPESYRRILRLRPRWTLRACPVEWSPDPPLLRVSP